jgi:hypothetical protein
MAEGMTEHCIGIQHPCAHLATRQYPAWTSADWETARTVWLPYCEQHYQDMLALAQPPEPEEYPASPEA